MYPEFCDLTKEQALEYYRYSEFFPMRIAVEQKVKSIMGKVLDVGCGNGIDAQWYRPDTYCGIDISPPLVWAARKLNPLHTFVLIPLNGVPFRDKSWDTVFCTAVLEHQHSFKQAKILFDDMVRVAKRRVVIGWYTPPWENSTEIREKQYGARHFHKTGYDNQYNRAELMSDFVGSMRREPFPPYGEIWVITKNEKWEVDNA